MGYIASQHIRRAVYSLALVATLTFGAQAPAHASGDGSSFISADTVVIGCTAGGGASAFAAVVPLMTTAFGGAVVTPAIVAAWTGIGCAVGVVSGLIAIGTAWGFETWNEMNGNPATRP